MSLCHWKEITPDPSSSTNVNVALICFTPGSKKKTKKKPFLQSWRPGGIPRDVFTVADTSANPQKTFIPDCDRAQSISTGKSAAPFFVQI